MRPLRSPQNPIGRGFAPNPGRHYPTAQAMRVIPLSVLRADGGAAGQGAKGLERVKGIEPSLKAWEAFVLPLNYTR